MDEYLYLFEQFITAWAGSSLAARTCDGSNPDALTSDGTVLRRLCPPLPGAPRRSFRPHEVCPALYLGGIGDVTPVQQLCSSLLKGSKERIASPSLTARPGSRSPPPVGESALMHGEHPHSLYLLVCASDVSVPHAQLELRCLSTSGQGQRVIGSSGGGGGCSSTAKMKPPSPAASPADDRLHKQFKLMDFVHRFSDGHTQQQLQSTADAMWSWMESAMAEARARTCCDDAVDDAGGSKKKDKWYWKLRLPIVDVPTACIAQYFPATSALIQAVLTAPNQPSPPRTPCVVVHCVAGKSRSATLIISFIIRAWFQMPCARGSTLLNAVKGIMVAQNMSAAHKAVVPLSDRLVAAVVKAVQRVRLCVCPNEGFYDQLRTDTEQLMLSFLADSDTVTLP